MGELFVIATPIGNREDISLRALRLLKEVDLVLCEDTRVTKKLLSLYDISTPLESYHQHSGLQKQEKVAQMLKEGKKIGLVTDAGTPGISDPGNELIAYLAEYAPEAKITPVPGASSVAAIASIAGFPVDRFLFLGYPPHKKKRSSFFRQIAEASYPVVFLESPYRILKSLRELQEMAPDTRVVVGRELTKTFETIYRGTIDKVADMLEKERIRGEFVVVAYKEET